MAEEAEGTPQRRMSMGTKILIGVLAGIAVGVFLGDWSSPLRVVGRIYVSLLQMTVLPYVVVSLMTKVGRLSPMQARRLAGRAAIVLLALWTISLAVVVVLPISLPEWEAGTFFSSSLVKRPAELDFLELYIPTNPFHSLANNIVPAVVIFSILIGAALIGIENKERMLGPLGVFGDSLGRVSAGIVALSPYGTFALAAGAAGTLSPAEMLRLGGYVSSYTVGVLLLTFIVLPGFTALLTPHAYGRILSRMREALLTAFATGKLFAVLPMVIHDVKGLLVEREVPEKEAQATADLLVPLAYPFPNAGRILSILFIPFAAWFIGQPLDLVDYPMLLSGGLLAFFGSPVAAIPFLLDMFRRPVDLLALFLVAGIWCARIGDVLGAMHLASFSLLCDAWNRGWLRFQAGRALRLAVGSALALVLLLYLNNFVVSKSIMVVPATRDLVVEMELWNELVTIEEDPEAGPHPTPRLEGEEYIQRVRRSGVLRVGYVPRTPPFSYRNRAGDLVGFDVDLAQRLARDLEVKLVLVPYDRDKLKEGFAADRFDLAIGGIPSSIRNWGSYRETVPYLDLHAAILVEDRRAKEFGSIQQTLQIPHLRLGYVKGGLLVRTGRHRHEGLEVVEVEDPEDFLRGNRPDIDALLCTAESGAIYSMLYPRFSVVVPEGILTKVPVVFAVHRAGEFARLVDTWLELKRADGTMEVLYDHWILGKGREKSGEQRWSVIRNVLGWVE